MMSGEEERDISDVVCATLDHLGFNKENISLRSKSADELNELAYSILKNVHGCLFTAVSVGSSAEGVQLSDSDLDAMFVSENILCLDHEDICENIIILEVDQTNTSPGYTRLVSKHQFRIRSTLSALLQMSKIDKSLVKNYPYVSSLNFRQLCFNCLSFQDDIKYYENYECHKTTNGPAITYTADSGILTSENDNVFAFYYYGGNYLYRWAKRARHYTWPSGDVIKEISEMEGYVVPVGDKQSENQNLEWRICFTTAEKKLVSNLDGIQLKVYVLLKLLAKRIIKPVCKAVTSYVMKNVVFWISETTHVKSISPDDIMQLLLKSLHFLKTCFENNHLPNYMIEERNLLRGTVCIHEKSAIISLLSECLKERSRVLLRIPHFCHYLNIMLKTPESMAEFGSWRHEVEKLKVAVELEKWKDFDWKLLSYPRLLAELKNDKKNRSSEIQLFLTVVPESVHFAPHERSVEDLVELFHQRMKGLKLL